MAPTLNMEVGIAQTTSQAAEMVYENGAPDMVSLYAFAETAYGIGTYHELAYNWITNGPEAGFLPYPTYTGGATEGWGVAGIGVGLRLGWSLSEQPSIHDIYGAGLNIAGSIGPNLSTDIGLSIDRNRVNAINISLGYGVSLPSPFGYYTSQTWTAPIGE